MAILDILEYPDPRLRTVATNVDVVDDDVRALVSNMFETMYDAPGIGLATSQVDVHKRIIVMDVSDDRSDPLVFINPVIQGREGKQTCEEGCLSVPGIYAKVERFKLVTIHALNEQGHDFTMDADELLSVCIQHEMDHLEGRLFVDYLSPLKRRMVDKKMNKRQREKIA